MPRVELTDRFVDRTKPKAERVDYFDANTPGLALRVAPGGRKVWSFVFTAPGSDRRARASLGSYPGTSLAAARTKAIEARGYLDENPPRDPRDILAAQDASALTVAMLCESYLEKHVKPNLRSAANFEQRLRKNVIPVIGAIRLADLHRRDINRVIDPIVKRGKPTEANRVFENVRATLRWAAKRGDLDKNPIEGMAKPAAENGARERTLTDDEIRQLWIMLPAALRQSTTCQRIVRLCLTTGQRVGEVAGMRRAELDLKARNWALPGARTKNGTRHVVPLANSAIAIIREALADASEKSDFVFPSPAADGEGSTKPIDPHAVATALRRAQKPTKAHPMGRFGMAQFTAHDMRRTVLTHLAKLGVQPIVIGAVANHLSVTKASVTFLHYVQHDYAREKREALDLWAERLAAIIEGDAAKVLPMRAAQT